MSNTPPPPPPPPGQQPPQGSSAPQPPQGSPPPGSPPPGSPPPAGYQAYQQPATGTSQAPADYGQRVIAYLIDLGLLLVVFVVGIIIGAVINEALGAIIAFLGYIGVGIYNLLYLQGTTGQTIGKKQQDISLVKDDSGQPVGVGMTFVRYLLAGAASGITCGIYGLLDFLWPLWDEDKKRLTDKILNFSVVKS